MDFSSLIAAGGPYAVIGVLCGVVAKLWSDLQSAQVGRLEDTKQANASVYAALRTIDTTISALQSLGNRK